MFSVTTKELLIRHSALEKSGVKPTDPNIQGLELKYISDMLGLVEAMKQTQRHYHDTITSLLNQMDNLKYELLALKGR